MLIRIKVTDCIIGIGIANFRYVLLFAAFRQKERYSSSLRKSGGFVGNQDARLSSHSKIPGWPMSQVNRLSIQGSILCQLVLTWCIESSPHVGPGKSPVKAIPSSRIKLILSSVCPGVGMISPPMPKCNKNARLSLKLRFRLSSRVSQGKDYLVSYTWATLG